MISHLLLVGFRPFHHRSLVSYIFASVGTREEVGGTTIRGERAPDVFGDARAIFFGDADVGGCREDSDWMNVMGTSGDDFGCWEEDGKGLG